MKKLSKLSLYYSLITIIAVMISFTSCSALNALFNSIIPWVVIIGFIILMLIIAKANA